jgi:serine phosphatase RsbU (regulator of sigma subunit)
MDWPKPSDFKKSIRFEFTLYVSAVVIGMMLFTGYIVSNRYVNTVTRSVIDKMVTQARSYSGPAGKLIIGSSTPDILLLSNTCKQLAGANHDVYWAGISDRGGAFIAHTDMRKVLTSEIAAEPQSGQYNDLLMTGEGVHSTDDTIYISVPIVENNVEVGRLSVAASTAPIKAARRSSTLLIAIITAGMIAIGVPLTMVVLHKKLRPFGLIIESLKNANIDDIRIDISLQGRDEFAYLADTLRTMGRKLNIAQKDLIEQHRIAQELDIAREIQESILPKSIPRSTNFGIGVTYRSALEVGGDYYDFIQLDDDHLMMLIADVSGKSLPGMLVMLITRDIVKRVARPDKSPKEILSEVNDELLENIRKGMFVTMFLGILSTKTGQVTYASAGHNPILHLSSDSGKASYIKTKGFPLGMMPTSAFASRLEQGNIRLRSRDILLQYTDGVNEALSASEEEFGFDRFARFVESHHELEPGVFVQRFIEEHAQFVGDAKQYDDITLLILKWLGASSDNRLKGSESILYADRAGHRS